MRSAYPNLMREKLNWNLDMSHVKASVVSWNLYETELNEYKFSNKLFLL